MSTTSSSFGFMRLMRIVIASLPVDDTAKAIFDMLFNWIIKVVASVKCFTGAYCMFKITPGALMSMSPLLAQSSDGFSFPGHPVSLKYVGFNIINTTKMSERSGRWAAVFIPYREPHDDKEIPDTLKKLTFQQVCSMPHAQSGPANMAIRLHFKMRDKTMYCARPRELSESIGICAVFWDVSRDQDVIGEQIPASNFSCELNLYAGCVPHVIFGPTHRMVYPAATFELPTLTNGLARLDFEDGEQHIVEMDHVDTVIRQRQIEKEIRDLDMEPVPPFVGAKKL